MFQKLWVWAKETQLNPNELKSKLLLATDKYGYIAWHQAAERGSLQAIETLWIWAKEVGLNMDELLLAKNKQGDTARLLATKRRHLDVVEKLGVWENKAQLNPQFHKRWKHDLSLLLK
jgi:ankyrin repeat protein